MCPVINNIEIIVLVPALVLINLHDDVSRYPKLDAKIPAGL